MARGQGAESACGTCRSSENSTGTDLAAAWRF